MTLNLNFRALRENFELSVDLSLPARGITALFGPSGSGKTTLLRAIAGLDQIPDGFISLGEHIWQNDKVFLAAHKRRIGYVFQEPSLFPHLSVEKNIRFASKRAVPTAGHIGLSGLTELLGLTTLMGRFPHQLSGGEQQRVAIARALSANPILLLMDEPLASLDDDRKQEILPYLDSLHNDLNIPIVYVSHSADEVARLADYLVLLDAGQVVAADEIAGLLTRLDLPLARGADAEAIVDARVREQDPIYALTYLDSTLGPVIVPHLELPIDRAVRVRILARDVSITLSRQEGTSILNSFPATIVDMSPAGDSQMMIQLQCGEALLLARVTRKSAVMLNLVRGKQVYAQTKSVALLA